MPSYQRRTYRLEVSEPWSGSAAEVDLESDTLWLSGSPGAPLFFSLDASNGGDLRSEVGRRWKDARIGHPDRVQVAGQEREALAFEVGHDPAQATGCVIPIDAPAGRLCLIFGHAGPLRGCAEIASHDDIAPLLASLELHGA